MKKGKRRRSATTEATTEQAAKTAPALKVTNNCWAIYRENCDTLAQIGRPQDWQDWGDPVHPLVRVYSLDAPSMGYRNEVHCWLQVQPGEAIQEYFHLEMFAGLIAQILIPGTPRDLSDRSHLAEDDFWGKAWGVMPPLVSEDVEEYGESEEEH